MPTFEAWDVVKVPFPYTDRPVRQHRPALVVAAGSLEDDHGLLWVLMITSAENRAWRDDVAVSDLTTAGLPAPSVVRCAKIATIEARDTQRIGRLPAPDRARVSRHLHRTLSATGGPRRAMQRKAARMATEEIIGESRRHNLDEKAINALIDEGRRG